MASACAVLAPAAASRCALADRGTDAGPSAAHRCPGALAAGRPARCLQPRRASRRLRVAAATEGPGGGSGEYKGPGTNPLLKPLPSDFGARDEKKKMNFGGGGISSSSPFGTAPMNAPAAPASPAPSPFGDPSAPLKPVKPYDPLSASKPAFTTARKSVPAFEEYQAPARGAAPADARPWWQQIPVPSGGQIFIVLSFTTIIGLMLATAAVVNNMGAIHFNDS